MNMNMWIDKLDMDQEVASFCNDGKGTVLFEAALGGDLNQVHNLNHWPCALLWRLSLIRKS
jgi:hypothetical protein